MQSLSIHNYKSLVNFELRNINPFTVFVGANGVGKTNVFEALEYLNFKYFNNWQEVDEIFGGKSAFFNQKLLRDTLRVDIINGENFFLNFVKDYDDVKGQDSNPLFLDEGVEFKKLFLDNFSRIFLNTREANKINTSSSSKKLNFNGDNLEYVLQRLLLEDKAEGIIDWLNLVRPGFENIKIEKGLSETPVLQFYEAGYEKPFGKKLISDGTFNILCILTAIYQSEEPQFLCIEEPENGLNPYVLTELVKFIRTICKEKGHYIWMNTHSQTIVNNLLPEEMIILNKEDGITKAKQLTEKDLFGLQMDEAWLTNVLGGGVPC
jgi:predicted ATPase